MKILFVTDLYPVKKDERSTPRTLSNFVDEWKKFGHIVTVIKPNFILNSFLRKKPYYKDGNYNDVINLNYILPFIGSIKNKLNKYYNEKPDVIIAHMPSGILFADKLGLPFIAGIHNSDLEVLTKPLYSFYFRRRMLKALRNAKAIACRSYVIEEKLLKFYPEFSDKTFVAPSGIDENIIIEKTSSFSYPIKVLTAAQFKKRKNIDKVIKALKNLEGFELTVIGDGKEKTKLEKIDKNVKFTGWLRKEKVLEKMRESDIFILPSQGETFGMVYLEAMASGCITICTEYDAIDGIIKNGQNGFTTIPVSSEIRKLLLKIKNMDDEKVKALHYNSFCTVKDFTLHKCSENYLQQIFKFL